MNLIIPFEKIGIEDVPIVGGKNASLGEMYATLSSKGILVPNGFAVTSYAYRQFLAFNGIENKLTSILNELDTIEFSNLSEIGRKARELILQAEFPSDLKNEILLSYQRLKADSGEDKSFAVRSSATAEDLPTASFAGQQETFLNVKGEENLILACHRCYASLFTNRAIKYRVDHGFEHMKVSLSIGVQMMIRSDLACSGVMFTLDPDSGFENVVLISGAWGLGENVVQGAVNTDEFMVFKTLLDQVRQPIFSKKLGSKLKTMVFAPNSEKELSRPEDAIENIKTPKDKQQEFVLNDDEIKILTKAAILIENHYGRHMDIEWAKDGVDGKLYIVQARPETVHSQSSYTIFKQYTNLTKGKLITQGAGIGRKIVSGKARILHSASDIDKLNKGDILVTGHTDPDWDPILKKALAVITDQGGRTSHAAIVARELGAIAVVGTGNATELITDGQTLTVSTVEGTTGFIYEGQLSWEEHEIDISKISKPKTKVMFILAHPDQAFSYAQLPNDGVGLMRMEFIISNAIGIHPMALVDFEKVTDHTVRGEIEKLTATFPTKESYFVQKLAEATAKMAVAFYPKDVIVRMSDFKSNEYANLLGGSFFEPKEENPMIGFRGASRYAHPLFLEAFRLECEAMKIVRDDMGLTNVKLMIPFCRTTQEAKDVIEVMVNNGLKRGENGLELYMMVEIPSNALLAEEFAEHFDGFSIGSNDLTQLTLGIDRDSELLSNQFSPFDPAVMQLIKMTLEKAKKTNTPTGLCGQAPSDYPEYAQFLVENGITSISFNPDALITGIENILEAEKKILK